jgi:hypothetical protein
METTKLKKFGLIKGEGAIFKDGNIMIPDLNINDDHKNIIITRSALHIRSAETFRNGIIELKFKSNNYSTGVLLVFDTPTTVGEGIVIGLSKTKNCFLIASDGKTLSPIVQNGCFKNYNLEDEHTLKVEINGSYAKLFIDEILMCDTNITINESIITFRLNSDGELNVYDVRVSKIKPQVFVIMQFTEEYNNLYNDVIKPISIEMGYDCIRADEFYKSTPIMNDVIESIKNATTIIADITPDNPNVYYEIGYSHAMNKPTILLCDKSREKLPFDLTGFRSLFYENTIAGKKQIEKSLIKYLSQKE